MFSKSTTVPAIAMGGRVIKSVHPPLASYFLNVLNDIYAPIIAVIEHVPMEVDTE
jgi:hypothetical protein